MTAYFLEKNEDINNRCCVRCLTLEFMEQYNIT